MLTYTTSIHQELIWQDAKHSPVSRRWHMNTVYWDWVLLNNHRWARRRRRSTSVDDKVGHHCQLNVLIWKPCELLGSRNLNAGCSCRHFCQDISTNVWEDVINFHVDLLCLVLYIHRYAQWKNSTIWSKTHHQTDNKTVVQFLASL